METQLPAPKRGTASQFSAHVCCGQTAGWIKMSLGREVGLGPGDILLNRTQLLPPKTKGGHSPHFLALVYCGQTVAHLSNCWAVVTFSSARTKTPVVSARNVTIHPAERRRVECTLWCRTISNAYTEPQHVAKVKIDLTDSRADVFVVLLCWMCVVSWSPTTQQLCNYSTQHVNASATSFVLSRRDTLLSIMSIFSFVMRRGSV